MISSLQVSLYVWHNNEKLLLYFEWGEQYGANGFGPDGHADKRKAQSIWVYTGGDGWAVKYIIQFLYKDREWISGALAGYADSDCHYFANITG